MKNNKIGSFIALLRKEKNLTQEELGKKLYITGKAVSKWERGISLPDISLLKSLASVLDVSETEILNGERSKENIIEVEEEVNNALAKMRLEYANRRKKNIKLGLISLAIILAIGVIFLFSILYYNRYHPKKIIIGENYYSLGYYNLEKDGLNKIIEIIGMSENTTSKYNVSSFESTVNRGCAVENFALSVKFFDNNDNYVGRAGYNYNKKKLTYTYVKKEDENIDLVETYSKNSSITYINTNLKRIPLKEQIKLSDLKHYVVSYMPNVNLEKDTPIIDGRNDKKIKALSKKDYNNFVGGKSEKDVYFAIRLNDGSSIATNQQYLFVFSFLETETAHNDYAMEMDYLINNDKLQFTRDYGKNWIDTDISKEDVEETLSFYRDISLVENSWFISLDESLPIAYFYGKDAKLKISNDNGKTWNEHIFDISLETEKDITQRVVGFTSETFGYVALGTDWTMGSGEIKVLYFTYDGGKTWSEVDVPLNNSVHILYDVYMLDEKVGIIVLRDTIDSAFPLIYSTISGGKEWNEVRYADTNLPDEITFLYDVDRIEKNDEGYNITMGQGNAGTIKVIFRTGDLMGWSYKGITNQNIHHVG